MNAHVSAESKPKKRWRGPNSCTVCAGLGQRYVEDCTHLMLDDYKGRRAIRAAYDTQGRWMVQWEDADGEQWVGTYRLIPV